MSGRTRSRRRIETDIEQTRNELGETVTALARKTDVQARARTATKETVHDATARIKEAAERAAAQASETTQKVTAKADETAHVVAEKAGEATHVVPEKAEEVAETVTEKTVDLRQQVVKTEQVAKSAEVTQDLSGRTVATAKVAEEKPKDHHHLGQPTAERATRVVNNAADAGGRLAHQVADTARYQLTDGRPVERLRRPVPMALVGAAAAVLTGAIVLFRHRRR